MTTAAELIREAAGRLIASGFDSPRLDAEVLLRHVLGLDRTHLFLRLHEPVSDDSSIEFDRIIDQRLTGESVAYLTGEREFMGLPFMVGPGVLVPRPETEMLVEWALAWIGNHSPKRVIDVGTGSGAIILSIALSLPRTEIPLLIGCDLSGEALVFADRNRESLGLESRVHLVRGDLLTWLGSPVDLILANLPYLRPDQVMDNREIQTEPEIALISGEDGLQAVQRLIGDLPRVLAPGGAVILELDPEQADRVALMINELVPGAHSEILRDLSGRKRFVVAELCSIALS